MIGEMRERITIETPVAGRNEINDEVINWDVYAETFAKVERLRGSEFMAARMAQSNVVVRITIRERAGLDTTMRVKHRMWTYAIESIVPGEPGYLEMMCGGPAGLT